MFPGPGVLHIGLCTDDIEKTVSILTLSGVQFRTPPPAYYSLVSLEICLLTLYINYFKEEKTNQFMISRFSLDRCKKLGILIDTEEMDEKFLLQIFTKPMFKFDTFFMEVIQRDGALGFGAGNIKALALSISKSPN